MMPEVAASFASGFVHPLHGADHLVAMLAVATGALHAIGISMCCLAGGSIGRVALRTMGAIAALGGVLAMVGRP
jgi:hydrogenase/urease accessory protein HupE